MPNAEWCTRGPNAEVLNAANAEPDPNAGKRRTPKRRTQPNANAANAEWIQTQANETQGCNKCAQLIWGYFYILRNLDSGQEI